MLRYLVFSNNFDSTFDGALFVASNANLAEAAFTQYLSKLISLLNVVYLLKALEVFKGFYFLK